MIVVGKIDEAEPALAQQGFDAITADLSRRGLPGNGVIWIPCGFVNGLFEVVHARPSQFEMSHAMPSILAEATSTVIRKADAD